MSDFTNAEGPVLILETETYRTFCLVSMEAKRCRLLLDASRHAVRTRILHHEDVRGEVRFAHARTAAAAKQANALATTPGPALISILPDLEPISVVHTERSVEPSGHLYWIARTAKGSIRSRGAAAWEAPLAALHTARECDVPALLETLREMRTPPGVFDSLLLDGVQTSLGVREFTAHLRREDVARLLRSPVRETRLRAMEMAGIVDDRDRGRIAQHDAPQSEAGADAGPTSEPTRRRRRRAGGGTGT